MSWTAIPFSDITSRESVRRRCGIPRLYWYPLSFVFDSTGKVLQYNKSWLFNKYGSMGYPFSKERIEFLESQDDADATQPSLRALLASPDRDYVISNNGDKVSINTLEEKVVALYFYEEGNTGDWLTIKLKMAYELQKSKGNFEVVLIYLYDTKDTCGHTNEESFWKTFNTMPWLALSFRDPNYRKLKRFFGYNYDLDGDEETPTILIFGPHGEFVEPWGVNMLVYMKTLAYPFTREKVAKLETEKVKELKLEMLWDQNALLRRKDGTQVQMSQLANKRIIVFFEGNDYNKENVVEFLKMLKERHFYMKGTDDEFEVIHVTCSKKESPYSEHIADMPWLVSLASELLPVDLSLYCCYCQHRSSFPADTNCPPDWQCLRSSVLAFDRDGRLVRKSLRLSVEDKSFPFYVGGMENEAFFELNDFFGWDSKDKSYHGLLINSFTKSVLYP